MQPHMERRPRADVKHITDIRPGDYFYMCSDGMLEQMEDDNICFNFSAMTGDDPNKVRVLTEATHYNHDNHTAFIIHILDVEGKPEPLEERMSENLCQKPRRCHRCLKLKLRMAMMNVSLLRLKMAMKNKNQRLLITMRQQQCLRWLDILVAEM